MGKRSKEELVNEGSVSWIFHLFCAWTGITEFFNNVETILNLKEKQKGHTPAFHLNFFLSLLSVIFLNLSSYEVCNPHPPTHLHLIAVLRFRPSRRS